MPADPSARAFAAQLPVPEYDGTPFTLPPALTTARVALVTTAALHTEDESPARGRDASFRVLTGRDPLRLGHESPNFDRTGWLSDPNVVVPFDRLAERARDGRIGSVAPRHLAFAGNQHAETLTTIRLDTGPAAARLLRADGVDVVLLTPV